MNKLQKGLKALGLVLRRPYLLNNVLNSEEVYREEFVRRHGLPDGLPLLRMEELFPAFEEVVAPYAYLSGATMPIDIALLKGLARRQNAQSYFEIGTWRGESVANVADVVPRCVTLNLPEEDILALTGDERYAQAHAMYSKDLANVTHVQGDSRNFDFGPFRRQFDLVFIDGDHHHETVLKDTANAFELLRDDKAVIVWHDYAYDPETVRWSVLSAIWEATPADKRPFLYHVSNTLCAVYIPERFKTEKLVPYAPQNRSFEVKLSFDRRTAANR